jgi:GT2 family glycosyltransferase
MHRIAALITSYNRREKTLVCLKNLMNQAGVTDLAISVFLVDDNSSDGTSEAVRAGFPAVHIIKGSGQLFWAGGMRTAWRAAISSGESFDYYMLVNDDTFLFPNALQLLFADVEKINREAIIVGCIKDPSTGDFSYGGRVLRNRYNIATDILIPNNTPQQCDFGNGNLMLIPAGVVDKVGILTDRYTHGLADIEYTTKAKKAGIPSYTTSVYIGECTNDFDPSKKKKLSFKKRVEYLYSVKGDAYREYLHFIREHFPLYLPQAWLSLWIKTILPGF